MSLRHYLIMCFYWYTYLLSVTSSLLLLPFLMTSLSTHSHTYTHHIYTPETCVQWSLNKKKSGHKVPILFTDFAFTYTVYISNTYAKTSFIKLAYLLNIEQSPGKHTVCWLICWDYITSLKAFTASGHTGIVPGNMIYGGHIIYWYASKLLCRIKLRNWALLSLNVLWFVQHSLFKTGTIYHK